VLSWEKRFGVVKIAPLVNWGAGEVDECVSERNIPLNPLLGGGYKSIGCAPCTRPVSKDEDARAGRWPGMDKTECGLHFVGGAVKRANP
jgi:phosphoadenosine phosphosulfate reductase